MSAKRETDCLISSTFSSHRSLTHIGGRDARDPDQEKEALEAPLFLSDSCYPGLEITAAPIVAAIAIQLNGFAGAFTRGAAILAARLRWTGTNRILTLWFLVCHASLLVSSS